MPAAAVIPAPIGYIKVVAVKKLVVEFLVVCFWFLNFVRDEILRELPFCGFTFCLVVNSIE